MALIFSLLILAAIVALAWVYTMRSPLPAHPAEVTVTATGTATSIPQPARTSSPTLVRRSTPTSVPTSTRSLQFTSPLPEATASVPGGQANCHEDTGLVLDQVYYSRISNTEQRYLVYLPPCFELSDRRYPTIYLLHGTENDETHWEQLGVFQKMDQGLAEGRLAPAIIVLPDGDPDLFINTSGGPRSFEGQIVDELVSIVDQSFRTDPRPEMRAIGGISRGGVWSLEIGFLHPELFSVVGAHSPCLNLNESPPQWDPLALAGTPSLSTQRIWLDAGDADYCQPGAEALHNALDEAGVAHEYHVWPGEHQDPLWAEHLPVYLEFYTRAWPK
jgi:enterochelin esterase-like enzyme